MDKTQEKELIDLILAAKKDVDYSFNACIEGAITFTELQARILLLAYHVNNHILHATLAEYNKD